MKASEVLKLLRIFRPILTKYIKKSLIKGTKLANGYYDYDAESVYALLSENIPRRIVVCARISTKKQKKSWKPK
ncbi:MAG: hypothetical protein ACFFD2_00110 [Promethearchaeota archaeon]